MKTRGGRLRRRVSLALVVLVAVPVVGFAWFLAAAAAPPAEPQRHADAIAVLTGGAERVATGLRLLREGRADRLMISGVHPDVTLAELTRLAEPDRAVPEVEGPGIASSGGPGENQTEDQEAARVTLGRTATTTHGNAREIAAWAQSAGVRSIRVVTAGYHMPRATLELRRAFPEAILLPHPVLPPTLRDAGAAARLRTWSLLFGEYLKWLGAAAGLASLAGGGEPDLRPQ